MSATNQHLHPHKAARNVLMRERWGVLDSLAINKKKIMGNHTKVIDHLLYSVHSNVANKLLLLFPALLISLTNPQVSQAVPSPFFNSNCIDLVDAGEG